MKKAILSIELLSVIALTSFIYSCSKDDNKTPASNMYNISASMTPAQETGTLSGNPTGSGTTTGTYNADTKSLQYNVTWTGLTGTATAGHFHGPAAVGATAGPIITFTLNSNGTAGTASGTATLNATQEADLLAGKWYANIHTPTNGGGEIRGQVTAVHQ